MKYFDAFSGYGGFSLGIQQAYEFTRYFNVSKKRGGEKTTEGINEERERLHSIPSTDEGQPHCIGFSEIDKYACQIYSKHFPTHKNYGDITKINASELPDFDLFVGGFPCQAFSIAGKRAGFEDTRGTLIYDVLRIVKEKHPRLVLLENVKGLLSHDGGRTFKTIISAIAELGYAVEWQVLNAKNFGVPQNRERVFIIGHLGGFGGRQVFPIGAIPTKVASEHLYKTSIKYQDGKRRLEYRKTDIFNCLRAGTYDSEVNYIHAARIRRLTPTECERLMGLPDGWTEGVRDTQRYKLCGNGVVINVVEEIIKKLTSNHNEYAKIHNLRRTI